jgi:hypothetical protein
MGIDPPALDQILRLRQAIPDLKSVMELGAQYVVCQRDPGKVSSFVSAFGGALPDASALAQGGEARKLYEAIGLSYRCIDSSGEFGALPLDLNFDAVPAEEKGKYGLVTNFGTSEHVANQINCFKAIHDLTQPGGYMIHGVPYTGYTVHGLINYTPKFFWALERGNRYELVKLYVHGNKLPTFHYRSMFKRIACNITPWLLTTNSVLFCTFRKVHDTPFVPPWDGLMEGMNDEQRRRYGPAESKI